MRISDRKFALFMMLPAAAFLSAFVLWPVITFVSNSFYKISPIAGGPREFIGFSNYMEALTSSSFQSAAQRT